MAHKVLTRTQRKGLRPLPPRLPDILSTRKTGRGEEEITRILNGEHPLDVKDQFLCRYVPMVCRFRLVQMKMSKEDGGNIYREITHLEEEAHTLGFTSEDLTAFNLVLRDKGNVGIEIILEKLKLKLKGKE